MGFLIKLAILAAALVLERLMGDMTWGRGWFDLTPWARSLRGWSVFSCLDDALLDGVEVLVFVFSPYYGWLRGGRMWERVDF